MKNVFLKKYGEVKALNGYQWIFSNEIKNIEDNIENGDIVNVYTCNNIFLGQAFYNKNSLISLRIISRTNGVIDSDFFKKKILQAYEFRKKLFSNTDIYRLVFSESDFLPGLIIDRYEDTFSIQTNSIGMDKHLSLIIDILIELFAPKSIIEKNESKLRLLEGLEQKTNVLYGKYDPKELIIDDIKYNINLLTGQKSGFFLDQRNNRKSIRQYVKNHNVLDCFCNEGGFSLNAAQAGAKHVLGLDISKNAIDKCMLNTQINNLSHCCEFEVCDVFDKLEQLTKDRMFFDTVIIDPPSFTKSKKNIPTATKAYKKINSLGLQLIETEGYLITSSCSHHINDNDFLNIINDAAVKAKANLQLIESHSAAPDHPILINMPETKYLKFLIFHVIKS
jgi:23S rRNA (cytosine1962-C5)-methyltransferase